jgi:plasmid stability protein
MPTQTVTLEIPAELYSRIRDRAERSKRSVEAEFLDVLVQAVSESDELPSELAEAIAPLDRLDDALLWNVARGRVPEEASAELESLHLKQQREGLNDVERKRADDLCFDYDRSMLVRARAAVLLKERGYGVSSLLDEK